jgi:mannose-1-phosphate guanylyltransferase
MKIRTVIMAGGRGERFWPRSRRARPKQFAAILSERTMLEDTVRRFDGELSREDIFISTGLAYAPTVRALDIVPAENIILEPSARDTAAAICLSVSSVQGDEDDVFFFTPADHFIADPHQYVVNLQAATELASKEEAIVLIGIKPTEPATGYGYIKIGEDHGGYHTVSAFREKPNAETAETYLESGDYLWNAGMFAFSRRTITQLFKDFAPEHSDKVAKYLSLKSSDASGAAKVFDSIPKISFDFAIMEKAPRVDCIKASFDWDDVGSWNALSRVLTTDKDDNLLTGSVISHHAHHVVCDNGDPKKTVVLNGVSGLHVILDGDVVYISTREHEAEVKQVLKEIEARKPELL